MEALVLPANPKSHSVIKTVNDICTKASTLQEIISRWIKNQKSLTIIRNDETPSPCLSIHFEHNNNTVAIGFFNIEQMVASCPGYQPLNEEVFKYADQEGFRADDPWFEARDERLNIAPDYDSPDPIIPPESVGEVVLSYALSSMGYARIYPNTQMKEWEGLDMITLDLRFIKDEPEVVWNEKGNVYSSALKKYVSDQQNQSEKERGCHLG